MSLEKMLIDTKDFFDYYLPSHKKYKIPYKNNDYNNFIKNLNSTPKCGSASHHLFLYDYNRETADYWQKPEDVFNRRKNGKIIGCCDSFAGIFMRAMNSAGKRARFLVMWGTDLSGDESGYATCFVIDSTETICTSNRVKHNTNCPEKIARYWYPKLKGYVLYDISNDDTCQRLEGKVYSRTEEKIFKFG